MGCTQPDLRYDFLVDIYKPIPNLPRTPDLEEDYFVFLVLDVVGDANGVLRC
jgi:hypothetical protein